MIITCKACNASFNLDESLLKPEGSKVRCSKCKEIFVAYPPVPPKEGDADVAFEDFELDLEAEPEKPSEDVAAEAKLEEPDELADWARTAHRIACETKKPKRKKTWRKRAT